MASTTSGPAPPKGVWRTTELSSIRYGPGCLREGLDAALKEDLGGRKRALIVTGKSLSTKTDVIKKVKEALGERYVATLDDIGQHAPVDAIHRAVELVKKEKIDVLISVGGGSPIDSSKAVSFYIHEEQNKDNEDPNSFIPSIAIPTTLSVAETTQNAGFTKDGKKTGVSHPALVPRVLILDAELTLSTPERLWLSSGMRAVDHAVEGLYRPGDFNWVLRNQNLGALRELFPLLRASKANPNDLRIRQKLQLAATSSLFPEKRRGNLGISHSLGHALGSTYQIPHGITSCLTLAHAIEYTAKLETTPTEQLLSLADALAYIAPQTNRLTDPAHPISIEEARQKGVEVGVEVGKLVRDLGLSTTLDEWKVPHEDYEGIASHAAGGDSAIASRVQTQILGRISTKGPGTGAGPSSASA
ncbi:Dehydroquinate synthase-like protein [Microstroma glucosiphilum]|uniref:Dehydroquinate synthase-like protein n=1 Tax=Pseudomicrostroma glucosiphilum TaxID=1684307 RepID=A0A316UBQ3_9BASI|nr:Dehydroquinate synthase-like protein [Pseudomicrostroma glucosiphilum]PWN22288.1 Dehydroquinate synthase-like protein [Pseudomicrostroma glucosiphilum]